MKVDCVRELNSVTISFSDTANNFKFRPCFIICPPVSLLIFFPLWDNTANLAIAYTHGPSPTSSDSVREWVIHTVLKLLLNFQRIPSPDVPRFFTLLLLQGKTQCSIFLNALLEFLNHPHAKISLSSYSLVGGICFSLKKRKSSILLKFVPILSCMKKKISNDTPCHQISTSTF